MHAQSAEIHKQSAELHKQSAELHKQSANIQFLADISLDDWKHETNSSAKSARNKLRKNLLKNFPETNGKITCFVTQALLSSPLISAGHIISRKNATRGQKMLGISDIDDSRNGVLWCEAIERAWSHNKICFVRASDQGASLVLLVSNNSL